MHGAERMQILLHTASVIALAVIALNLFLTCGLLLVAIFCLQRWTRRFAEWTDAALERSQAYASQAASAVDRAGQQAIQPIVWAEKKAAQAQRAAKTLL